MARALERTRRRRAEMRRDDLGNVFLRTARQHTLLPMEARRDDGGPSRSWMSWPPSNAA